MICNKNLGLSDFFQSFQLDYIADGRSDSALMVNFLLYNFF